MSRPPTRTDPGRHESEGARRLRLAIERDPDTRTRLVGAAGTPPAGSQVWRWAWGDSRPGLAWADVLSAVLGIPHTAWNTAPAARRRRTS